MDDDSVELYYLKSRHYHPALCRFLQADSIIAKPLKLLGNNLYTYCRNSPVAKADHDGADAYWINDTNGAGGLGHASLLLEDIDGKWYYFYWGASGNILASAPMIVMKEIPITYRDNGDLDLQTLNTNLLNGNYENLERKENHRNYETAYHFKGDFSSSVALAKKLETEFNTPNGKLNNVPAYNVLNVNCMQVSATIMNESVKNNAPKMVGILRLMMSSIIPDLAAFLLSLYKPQIIP